MKRVAQCEKCGLNHLEGDDHHCGRAIHENSMKCSEIIREANERTERDSVNHPSHYRQGHIEVLEFLEDQALDGHEWNAVKYICRARWKNNQIEDLKKAVFYLNRKIEILSAIGEGREPLRPNEMNGR